MTIKQITMPKEFDKKPSRAYRHTNIFYRRRAKLLASTASDPDPEQCSNPTNLRDPSGIGTIKSKSQ